jgi:hypothetical protein
MRWLSLLLYNSSGYSVHVLLLLNSGCFSLPQRWLMLLLYNSSGYSVHVFVSLNQWLLFFAAAVADAVTL